MNRLAADGRLAKENGHFVVMSYTNGNGSTPHDDSESERERENPLLRDFPFEPAEISAGE